MYTVSTPLSESITAESFLRFSIWLIEWLGKNMIDLLSNGKLLILGEGQSCWN